MCGVWQATLGRGATLEQWAGWLERCVGSALGGHEARADFVPRARRLLLDWSFYSSLVIRELTLRYVPHPTTTNQQSNPQLPSN